MSTVTNDAKSSAHMSVPPANFGLGTWPARRATLAPRRIAWSFEGADTSFAEADRRIRKLSSAFTAAGISRGDRVAYIGFNHPALLETLFALGRIGAIAVLINARLSVEEVEYILTDSGAKALCFGREQRAIAKELSHRHESLFALSVDFNAAEDAPWADDFEAFLQSGHERGELAAVELTDPCLIMYTSGTTGRPKGAVLSHANMMFSGLNVLISTDVRTDDTVLAVAPLFHIAGLNGIVLPGFMKGAHTIIHRSFNPQAVVDALVNEGITSMFAVPAMLDAMAGVPGFAEMTFESMRTLIVGGAPVPNRVLKQWNSKGVEVQQGYGFTEASPAVTLLSSEYALEKEGSAGTPQFFVDVRIVDDNGNDVADGETGEILARGPNIMLGYWNREQDTRDSFDGDWYRSGDIAERDSDGFHFLRDRSKDMFISGGENVYPSEIESALLDVDGVAEAAVIGVPDERWGEVGKAFVVLAPNTSLDSAELLSALTNRLAKYKTPKYVEFVDTLPRTATGKVQKHFLRESSTTSGAS